ncbi:TPA: MoaD/ThiS family protein [Pseudomonas aeruginosa]|uniref:MoaD/ThiS family protein n=3 Tax=Pseudomonas aeruginosa group TaxID=136841 RepID=A0ABD7K8P2_PSEAI|nr:thiamine biosynthesis protein ThiS [Pseudomonas paraeruginosa]KAB0741328.1 MoaD/ThiS family protein [Pseudomonas aeruginosa]KSC52772.2 thiamine biosynthesis protein ThiS [Pseudomonas paraeruginosa]KSC94484.2 thiamine biosynthesis protein ThiS [Pseudomonas aeruginosa]KSD28787.2 thiamine biosynthesis protein ThiS [Pseudomonas aeruginosa]
MADERRCGACRPLGGPRQPWPAGLLHCSSRATSASPGMPRIVFAPAIQRHVAMPALEVSAASVAAALQAAFAREPRLRGYLLDDQGGLRRHVALFVDGVQVRDRRGLGDRLEADSEVYVVQALSGG